MDNLEAIKSLESLNISIFQVFISLLVSAICSYLISITYMKFGRSLNNRENFSNSFLMLGITTTLVISVVKFSFALSLGLVGALSIVRFRAAIKEPEELVYLFAIISIGIASGADQYKSTIIFTIFIILISFFQSKFRKSKKNQIGISSNLVQITYSNNIKNQIEKILENFFKTNCNYSTLKHIRNSDDRIIVNYSIDFKEDITHLDLMKAVSIFSKNNVHIEIINQVSIIE